MIRGDRKGTSIYGFMKAKKRDSPLNLKKNSLSFPGRRSGKGILGRGNSICKAWSHEKPSQILGGERGSGDCNIR